MRRPTALLVPLLAAGLLAGCTATVTGTPGGPGTPTSGTTTSQGPVDPDATVVTVVWARSTIAGPGAATTATLRGDGRVQVVTEQRGSDEQQVETRQLGTDAMPQVAAAIDVLRQAPEVQASITDVGSVTVRYPDGPRTVSLTVDDWPPSALTDLGGADRRTVETVLGLRSVLLGAPGAPSSGPSTTPTTR